MSKIGQCTCSFPLLKDYPYIEKLSMLKGIPLILFFQVVKKLEGQDVGDSQKTWESWQACWGLTPVHVMYVCKELTQPNAIAD